MPIDPVEQVRQLSLDLGVQDDPAPADAGEDEGTAAAPQSNGRNYESEAISKGWVPESEFKDDPSKWVDAETFVKRGERFNKNLQREVAELKATIESFKGTQAKAVKFYEEAIARKTAENAETMKQLRIARSEAQRNGEDETVVDIEDRIEALKKQQAEVEAVEAPQGLDPKATDPTTNPILQEWIEDGNDWFNDYPEVREIALALGEKMVAAGEKARGRPFLDKITEAMKVQFPRKLGKAKVANPQRIEGSSSNASTSSVSVNGKTARDLPEEDQKLMKQFIREGWVKDEKTYLESYFSR